MRIALALLAVALALAGCGIIKPDNPDLMYGPSSTFGDAERRGHGA